MLFLNEWNTIIMNDILTFSDGSFKALRSSSSSSKIFSGLRGPFFTFESPLPSAFCINDKLMFEVIKSLATVQKQGNKKIIALD